MNRIKEYYNHVYDEWGRLERHRVEFEITRRVMDQYIPAHSKILDVGGGPGRYSIYLAGKGHGVTLFDLSENLVGQARTNAEKAGVALEGLYTGSILELDRCLSDCIYDVVLCMGPLYHLLEESDRKTAIKQCMERLKPGGILIASFISAYAPLIGCLEKEPHRIRANKDYFLNYFRDGRNVTETGFTDAYFVDPEKAEELFDPCKLEKLRFMATEGLGSLCESTLMGLDEEDFQAWMDLLYQISERRAIMGACQHLLYVGRKVG